MDTQNPGVPLVVGLPAIDRSQIKESSAERKSEKILLYNTKSYFWIAFLFSLIPVTYMTWKNTRYYSPELKRKLRKFIVAYLIVYLFLLLFVAPFIRVDSVFVAFLVWAIPIGPYFYYTNVNEYPTYKKMIDNQISRVRASVAPVVIGICVWIAFLSLTLIPEFRS